MEFAWRPNGKARSELSNQFDVPNISSISSARATESAPLPDQAEIRRRTDSVGKVRRALELKSRNWHQSRAP